MEASPPKKKESLSQNAFQKTCVLFLFIENCGMCLKFLDA